MIDTRHEFYRVRGAGARLFDIRETREVLLESAAGCGKTRAGLQLIDRLCWEWPWLRVLLCRETRKSMTETVLAVLENEVYWPGHPVLAASRAKRDQRSSYDYPNGSKIVVKGVEDFRSIMSAQFDVILYVEATDGTLEGWQYLLSRGLGRPTDEASEQTSKIPFKLAIAECNPDREDHWLNLRASPADGKPAKMLRLRMTHADNPSLDGERGRVYLGTLEGLVGPVRDRLWLGNWVSAEGLIFPNWSRARHLVLGAGNEDPRLNVPAKPDCYLAACDWGTRAAGVLTVFACMEDVRRDKTKGRPIRRAWRVEHIYQSEKSLSWWADQFERVWNTYRPEWIDADPARKDLIIHMNERLGPLSNRSGDAAVVVKANNAHHSRQGEKGDMVGLDLMRWCLEPAEDGIPRLLFVRDSLVGGEDPLRKQMHLATSLEGETSGQDGEIGSYRRIKTTEGGRVREIPDPACEDHEIDATRYFCSRYWTAEFKRAPRPVVVDMSRVAPGNRVFAKALKKYGVEAFAGDPRFKGFDPQMPLRDAEDEEYA